MMTSSRNRQALTSSIATCCILLLLPVGSTAASDCPPKCVCREISGISTVDCRAKSIADIRLEVYLEMTPEAEARVVELDVGDNPSIDVIARGSFPVGALRRLRLDGCRIRRVDSHTFVDIGLTLEELDLSGNGIELLADDAFDGLKSLKLLRLDGNALGVVSGSPFRGLSLDMLRLDSSGITSLSNSTFDGAAVASLNLDGNRLIELGSGSLRPLQRSLRHLSVARNGAASLRIVDDAFQGFAFANLTLCNSGLTRVSFLENVGSVEVLDIGGNSELRNISLSWASALALSCHDARLSGIGLTSVDATLMSHFRSVRRLDLSRNHLAEELDADVFRTVTELSHLDVSENEIDSLSVGFVGRLGKLETLNLTGNQITVVDERHLAVTDRLKVVDLRRNRIQVFRESAAEVFASLGSRIVVTGNPFHCNCEMVWFWNWMNSLGTDAGIDIGCKSPARLAGPITDNEVSDFACLPPVIGFVTPAVSVLEYSTVTLKCTGEGDPAPAIRWISPINDIYRVDPPDDRTQTRTFAIWELKRIRKSASGWYECRAGNAAGNETAYTYIHVRISADEPEVDLSDLSFPSTPGPLRLVTSTRPVVAASSLPTTTVFVEPLRSSPTSTRARGRTTARRDVTTSGLPPSSSTTTTERSAVESTTPSPPPPPSSIDAPTDSDALSSEDALTAGVDDAGSMPWKTVALIVGASVGGLLVVVAVAVTVGVVCVRRRRRRVHRGTTNGRRRGDGPRERRCQPSPREDRIRHPLVVPGVSLASSPSIGYADARNRIGVAGTDFRTFHGDPAVRRADALDVAEQSQHEQLLEPSPPSPPFEWTRS